MSLFLNYTKRVYYLELFNMWNLKNSNFFTYCLINSSFRMITYFKPFFSTCWYTFISINVKNKYYWYYYILTINHIDINIPNFIIIVLLHLFLTYFNITKMNGETHMYKFLIICLHMLELLIFIRSLIIPSASVVVCLISTWNMWHSLLSR